MTKRFAWTRDDFDRERVRQVKPHLKSVLDVPVPADLLLPLDESDRHRTYMKIASHYGARKRV